jgi:hypothetical protein
MGDTKPNTLWAFVSLVGGILGWGWGWIVALGCMLSLHQSGDTTGVALVGWILWLVFPSSVLCLLGVIFGLVALVRIRSGQYGGRWAALTGITLGCLPLAFALVSFLFLSWPR